MRPSPVAWPKQVLTGRTEANLHEGFLIVTLCNNKPVTYSVTFSHMYSLCLTSNDPWGAWHWNQRFVNFTVIISVILTMSAANIEPQFIPISSTLLKFWWNWACMSVSKGELPMDLILEMLSNSGNPLLWLCPSLNSIDVLSWLRRLPIAQVFWVSFLEEYGLYLWRM